MAKITIEELYRGEKYDIMSAVTVKALQLGIDGRTEEGRTWIEMELVRQTLIAVEQMKKNGEVDNRVDKTIIRVVDSNGETSSKTWNILWAYNKIKII